ncbi:unnamed protein product, partial [Brassica oleracea]
LSLSRLFFLYQIHKSIYSVFPPAPSSLSLFDISNFLKGVSSVTTKPPSFKGHYSTSFSFSLPGAVRHAHHHHFLCVSFDESEHVAVVMVSSSPPWSPVSSSHCLAPSSPSRARSVVTVSNSLRPRSVTTTLELAPKVIDGEGDRENTEEDSEKVEPEEEGCGGLRQFTTVR